ncbi:HEAT and armadillo repeat-containing protein [Plasmopara halstedii]|uniref:HEAT and armadillo repeat-containing protein n=1 Tax=Plasmopara halstedii TaxID=4781 RepID=A0A0N7L399_PLAHL|nr:HEAT and armadillo repeat-containing protein [Plasmopara halstedii]CEG35283.1 HEAT and armadillo repeat-containing protein [Plasmopara halstedii]|eukprot:XP_024571652.1 HEAT and armadillo repeat-containing protein [Plasmopara halstedii]
MSPAICAAGGMNVALGSSPSTGWNLSVQRRDRKLWTVAAERLEADVAVLQLTLVDLEEILKQLMGIALPNPRIRGDEIATLVTALAQILPLSSGLLSSEYTRLVLKCCGKERVLFSSAQLRVVMTFLLKFIKTCPSWYTANSIRALGQVLHDNADRASSEFEFLFAVLMKHLDPSGVDIEARYAATSCVSNICTQAGKTPEVYHYFSSLLRMVVENFRQQALSLIKGQNDRILVKACTSSVKCIFTIINSNFDRLNDRIAATLPSLLSSMRQVVGYGLVLKCDQNDFVFSLQEEIHPTESDTSICGSDNSTGGRQVGDGLLARLRITVLYTLEAIAQHFPKAITSSMGLYLPEQTTPYMTLFNNAPSVLTLLIMDPSEKARMTAAKFLDAFWEKIPLKMYFRRASGTATTSLLTSSMSFASMPKRISLMLYQMHITLVYCIQHEKESTPLAQILKSTASVIQHFPYGNVAAVLDQMELTPSLGNVLKALASSLYVAAGSTDHGVRMASLSCMSALLNVQETLPSILDWMVHTSDTDEVIRVAHVSIACGTWLLRRRSFVKELLFLASRPDDSSHTLLRLEAMSLLSKIAKNYTPALSANWQGLAEFMLVAFQDMDPNVRLQAVKILENYIKGGGCSSEKAVATCVISENCRIDCLEFMATHLVRAFYDTSHHVRASVCACFTLLSSQNWAWLGEKKQPRRLPVLAAKSGGYNGGGSNVSCLESYTRIFLQSSKDSSPVVRAAGFRLLGSLCLAPTFKTREFASNVVNLALDALSDSTLNVRVRAAWALGNVCTTPGPEAIGELESPLLPPCALLSSFVPSGESSLSCPLLSSKVLYDLLPAQQLRQVIEKMLLYINDNDKVASSVARTLGLVCRWISFPPFRRTLSSSKDRISIDELLGQAMVVLAGKINAGSPKVRWNACHAIAKVLLCPTLPLASVAWAPSVFQSLLTAVAQQENFKVRISAATALRVSQTRSAFGSFFQLALRATVDALETASDLKDVTEFRYKEQLETQLSFTLVHLIHIATVEDDSLILEALKAKPRGFLYDWLLHNLHRMVAAIERENDGSCGVNIAASDLTEDSRAGGSGDAHDVNPIKKEELLSAVCSLLRILERLNTDKAYATSCVSLLYDTKIGLEYDVLYSNEDIPFEL